MTRSLAALVLLSACETAGTSDDLSDADALAALIPTSAQLAVQMPDGSNARTSADFDTFYMMTRQSSSGVNSFVANWLDVIHDVIRLPAHTGDDGSLVWGPFHQGEGGLAPTTEYFTAQHNDDGTWSYHLIEAPRGEDNDIDNYSVIVAGRVLLGTSVEDSSGWFAVDFTTAQALDPMRDMVGMGLFAYDFTGESTAEWGGSPMVVAAMQDVASGDEVPFSAAYGYYRLPSGAGVMDMYLDSDIGGSSATEQWDIRSRWTEDGAGRTDGQVTGGDVGETVVTINDCWDESFQTVYLEDDQGWNEQVGDVSQCAFSDESLPDGFPDWMMDAIDEM